MVNPTGLFLIFPTAPLPEGNPELLAWSAVESWWRCQDPDLVAALQVLRGRLGMKVSMQFNCFPVTQPSVRYH